MNEDVKKKMLTVSAILFKHNVPIDEAKRIGGFIEELIQENQMLRLTVEKLTKQPYTYEIRGNDNE